VGILTSYQSLGDVQKTGNSLLMCAEILAQLQEGFGGEIRVKEYRYNIPFDKKTDCTSFCLFYPYGSNLCNKCNNCVYCGKRLYWNGKRLNACFEHIYPYISHGKKVVPLCKECNLSKGSKGLKQWLRWTRMYQPKKWERIMDNNKWKRSKVANAVRKVRDEQ
jgi:hypothetical protein